MKDTRLTVATGLLSAISGILFYFSVPLLPSAPFLKFDVSDIPALIGGFALGTKVGVIVEFVKCSIHISTSTTGGIGELASFLIGSIFIITACMFYKSKLTIRNVTNGKTRALLSLFIGTLSMTLFAALINRFFILPIFMGSISRIGLWQIALYGIIPFNLLKGALVSLMVFLIYKPISPFLK